MPVHCFILYSQIQRDLSALLQGCHVLNNIMMCFTSCSDAQLLPLLCSSGELLVNLLRAGAKRLALVRLRQ